MNPKQTHPWAPTLVAPVDPDQSVPLPAKPRHLQLVRNTSNDNDNPPPKGGGAVAVKDEMVMRAIAGDLHARNMLIENALLHRRRFMKWRFSANAEDALQDLAVAILKGWHTFDPAFGNDRAPHAAFERWSIRVATRVASRTCRKAKKDLKTRSLEAMDMERLLEESDCRADFEALDGVQQKLDELPRTEAEALGLWLAGVKLDGAQRKQKTRAIRRVRRLLGDDLDRNQRGGETPNEKLRLSSPRSPITEARPA